MTHYDSNVEVVEMLVQTLDTVRLSYSRDSTQLVCKLRDDEYDDVDGGISMKVWKKICLSRMFR